MLKSALLCLAFAAAGTAADPALLRLAMPDARVVAGVNVAQARGSVFGQFVLSQIAAGGADFQNFVTATGFDPRYNLDELLYASPGGAGEDRKLVLARGTFDPRRILDLARTAGAEIVTYQGLEVLRTPHAASGSPGSLVFLDDNIAAAGDDQSVREAIDRRQGSPSLNRDLSTRIASLSGSQDAWFVSLVPISELASRVPDTNLGGALKGDALRAINSANGGVKFAEPVRFSAEIVTRTAQDATSLADVLRFLTGLAQLQQPRPGQSSQLRGLLTTLDLSTEGSSVKLALAVPEQQLEAIVKRGRP